MGSCSPPEKYNLDARQLTDVTKIYQCLLSLLSNASKFTEAGEITLEVSQFRRKQEEGRGKQEEKFSFIVEEEIE